MRENLKRLLEQRANVVEQARELLERAESEGRALSGEAETTWQGHMDEVRRLDAQIKGIKDTLDAESVIEEARAYAAEAAQARGKGREKESSDADEFRAFWRGERGSTRTFYLPSNYSARALEAGVDSEGGYSVAEQFARSLYVGLRDLSVVRRLGARTLVTNSGDTLRLPKVATHKSNSSIVDEEGTFSESDPAFGQVVLDAYKYGHLTLVSSELTEDTAVNLIDFIVEDGRVALAEAQNQDFLTGTGTSQPNGIITAAAAGSNTTTLASASTVTADELFDIQHVLSRPYRAGAVWVMNDSTLKVIRKLKDADNQYLWRPGLTAGAEDTLLGSPVYADPNVAEFAVNANVILYANFRGYVIRDVNGVEVRRSDEYKFDTDQVAWRFKVRSDGDLLDDNAVSLGVAAAA